MRLRGFRSVAAVWGAPLFVGLVAFGCGGTTTHPATPTTTAAPVADVHVTAASFRSLKTMTSVRGFFVTNLMGNLAGTLSVRRSSSPTPVPVT